MNPRTGPEDTDWVTNDPADYLELEMDDDIFPDDFDTSDDGLELDFEREPRPTFFTPRQRIEMIREEQWLKDLVADFEDFDRIDGFGDEYVAELSH